MIRNLLTHPTVIYQTPDEEDGLAEEAICISVDAGGIISLEQGKNELVLNRASVPELCKVLTGLRKVEE